MNDKDLIERLRRYSYRQGTDDEQGQLIAELVDGMSKAADRLEKLNAERKKDCVDFFRWFWNAPGTNAEQGYDEWRAALDS